MIDHSCETAAGASELTGCVVITPADRYSTGQMADNVAQTPVTAAPAPTTHRQGGDGSRPSGKQITESVVSANAMTSGQTPSQPHHRSAGDDGECPIWRPKNSRAS